MKNEPTERGFDRFEFTDKYGEECSVQKSSLATEDCIWLGINRAKAIRLERNVGWIGVDLDPELQISTRMHLTREMVGDLIPLLQKFHETGELT